MKLVRALYWTIAALMALCFMAAVATTFAMTLSRYLLAYSDPTAEYLSRYFVILGTFLGFPVAVLTSLNVRFDLVDYMLPPRGRAIFQALGAIVSAAVSGVFVYASVLFVDDSMLFGEIMPTGFAMPLWIPHSAVLVGMTLGVLAYILVLVFGPIETDPNPDDPLHHP